MKYFVIVNDNCLECGSNIELFDNFDEAFEFAKEHNGIIYKGLEIVNFQKD